MNLFKNIRKPSDISEEEVDEIIKEYNLKVMADLINLVESELIESGDIFNHSVNELFTDLSDENTVLLMDRIGEIRFFDYLDRDDDFHKKKNEWFKDYQQFYKIREIKRQPIPNVNSKQQLLLVHYLQDAGLLNLNKMHQDQTKQAKVLSMLFGKGYENIYKDLRKSTTTKHQSEFDRIPYLKPIYELFLFLGLNETAERIKTRIDSISQKSKK